MQRKRSARRAKPKTPYADLLPPLSSEEFAALRADIRTHGVRDPVCLDEQGAVLDGHNRLRIDPDAPRRVIRGLSEAEKRAFTCRANFGRRNLSPAQKKAVLAKMKEIAAALRAEDPKLNTQRRVAELLGVSRACVSKWFQRARRGVPKGTCLHVHDESAFLADARFTIPTRVRPAILARHLAGESNVRIAADFKVDPSTISRIVRRYEADQRAAVAAAQAAARAAKLGDLGIVWGDYRLKGNCLADASVELIFTDPPYERRQLGQYAELGRFAARVLKPGGSLIAYLGDYALPEVLTLVLKSPELKFWWPLAVLHGGRTALVDKLGVVVRHKTLLWFVKGSQRARRAQVDSLVRSAPDKRFHQWGQGVEEAAYYIAKLTAPGALVVDPYAGGGTTCVAAAACGRRHLAFEKDRRAALGTRARLAEFLQRPADDAPD